MTLAIAIVALLVILMFLEFYDVAIVSEGLGAMDGLRASFAFVRKNLARVLPFFLIVLVAKCIVQLPLYVVDTLRMVAVFINMTANSSGNYSIFFNNTTTGTLNESFLNATLAAQATPVEHALADRRRRAADPPADHRLRLRDILQGRVLAMGEDLQDGEEDHGLRLRLLPGEERVIFPAPANRFSRHMSSY